MRRKLLFIIVGVIAVAAAIVVPRQFSRQQQVSRDPGGPPAAASAGPRRNTGPLKVFVHRVEPRALAETIKSTGTLLANESVQLRPEESGKVVAISFEEGARVKEGDPLLKINDSELKAELRRAIYRVDLAKSQEARQKQLLERGGTSQEAFDEATNQVNVLQSEADLIRAKLDKLEIRAPFSGVIGLRQVSVGSYLTTSTVVATLQDVDRLKIDFSISQQHMNRVHPGSPIRFTVAGSNRDHSGEVYAVEPAVDITTRTVILRAWADNPGTALLPGAFADVRVTLDEISDALLIPTNAIIPGLNQRLLYVIRNGKAEPRNVETGIRLDREIQITAGLAPGDVVITSGLLQLRPGMPVEPLHAEPEEPEPHAVAENEPANS